MASNFLQHFRSEPAKSLGGRYKIVKQLRSGGFGQTFLAQDLHLPGHPLCVIKQLITEAKSNQELQIARRLFDTEAQVLYQLGSHPQIPRLLAHFEDSKEFYLAQELIEGHSLSDELTTAIPWNDSQVIEFLDDILKTLAFVHEHHVIHRDLNPSNLIRRDSDNSLVLIDFGAVKQVSTLPNSPLNNCHTITIGTQGYMPNEQIAGRPQFSSDVYAVGMIAIQILTGRDPKTIEHHPQTGELDWHILAPHSHPALLSLLDHMIWYDFRSRYSNAAEALAALLSLSPNLSQSIPPAVFLSPAFGDKKLDSVTHSQQNTTLPPQPSPMAFQSIAVGQHLSETEALESTLGPYTISSTSRLSQKFVLPLGVGVAALLGLGLLAWQGYTSIFTVEIANTSPELPSPELEEVVPPKTATKPIAPSPHETPSPEPPVETTRPSLEVATPKPQTAETHIEDPTAANLKLAVNLTPATAKMTVASFYGYVANQAWDSARSLFDGQVDPNFFRQFQEVTVENLRVTKQTTETINLVGQNTYVYPDGSTQREERSYTVQQMRGSPPRIKASSFIRITKARHN